MASFQSRRVACDRCHRLKLRCERNPLLVNGHISVSQGPCKRCLKAGSPCTTSSSGLSRLQNSVDLTRAPISHPVSHNTTARSSVSHDSGVFGLSGNVLDVETPFNVNIMASECGSGHHTPALDRLGRDDFASSMHLSRPHSVPNPYGEGQTPLQDSRTKDQTAVAPNPQTYFDLDSLDTDSSMDYFSTHLEDSATTTSSSRLDSDEEFLQKTLGLQAILIHDLQHISKSDLRDTFQRPSSRGDESERSNGLVEKVIRASEHLIDLLNSPYLAKTLQTNGNGEQHQSSVTSPTDSPMVQRASSLQSTASQHSSWGNPIKGSTGSLGLPAIPLLLASYVGLLTVYRSVFTHIYDILRTGDDQIMGLDSRRSSTQPRPGGDIILNVRLQLEVMAHMLERIEDAWPSVLDEQSTISPLLNDQPNFTSVGGTGMGDAGLTASADSSVPSASTLGLLHVMLLYANFDLVSRTDRFGLENLIGIVQGIKTCIRCHPSSSLRGS